MEGETGWNQVFDPGTDRQHFWVLSDVYADGLSEAVKSALRDFMKEICGATDFPDPARLRHPDGYFDWGCPQWLRALNLQQPPENLEIRIASLERWMGRFKDFARFLIPSDGEYQWNRAPAHSSSGLGTALRTRRWLRSTKKLVTPPAGFADDPEIREFLQDTVPYVQAKLSPELLDKLGVHLRLTVMTLLDLLRQMQESGEVHKPDVVRIYQRLQTMDFDREVFRKERLVYLDSPRVRWMTTESVFWNDAGDVFDDDFGYASLTYSESELRGFFTEKLKIPVQPELSHYATAWQNLSSATSPDRPTVEKKLKTIIARFADSRKEFSDADWWRSLKPQLRLWTNHGKFQPPARVYVPDHSSAVELFAEKIQIAFPPKPNRAVLEFLRTIQCRSLEEAVQTKLIGASEESVCAASAYLTPEAKELCVLLVCSQPEWERRGSLLEALLETEEAGVKEITVEYSLRDDREAGTRRLPFDAHWDVANCRLLLRDGVDQESLRDAAAKSIAVEFFGEAASVEMQAEFFRVLMVGRERAQKLVRERSKWRLTPRQQDWLRRQGREILVTELDEVEPPPAPRPLAGPTVPNTPPPASATSLPSSAESTTVSQGTGSAGTQIAPNAPGQRGPEMPRSDVPTTRQEQKPKQRLTNDASAVLHDANTITADFVPVRAHNRSRPQRPRTQQTQETRRESSGLTSASADDKAALEECGRDVAARKLESMGYAVTPMSQHNPGFDLKAEKPGDILKIEVKSHAGEVNTVFLTKAEWKEYLATHGMRGEGWELWNVENLAKSSSKNPTIQRVRHIPPSAMTESGYWIDLSLCPQEPPKPGG